MRKLKMTKRNSRTVRAAYLAALIQGLRVTWPVLSGLLLFKAGTGAIVGVLEGWGIWQGIYFAFITGLTIGYGDLAPRQPLTQLLAVVIGFSGVLLTGLVAALAVKAIYAVPRESTDNA
jgi:Ion channel